MHTIRIAISGPPGCGKGTIARLVEWGLRCNGFSVAMSGGVPEGSDAIAPGRVLQVQAAAQVEIDVAEAA